MEFILQNGWVESEAEFCERVKAVIVKYINIVPKWCNAVYLDYLHDGDDQTEPLTHVTLASTKIISAYRYAIVTISSRCEALSDAELERVVIHELMHIHLSEIVRFCYSVVETFITCENTSSFMLEELTQKEEQLAEDLSSCITSNIDSDYSFSPYEKAKSFVAEDKEPLLAKFRARIGVNYHFTYE